MTQDWASKKVDLYIRKNGRWPVSTDAAAKLLRDEHQRDVRVVRVLEPSFFMSDIEQWAYAKGIRDAIAALRKGR